MSLESDVRIEAGDLQLDGRLTVPYGATRACILCHPHPLYGGNMHNAVVLAMVDELTASGIATLRFDFRGVGRSTGSHAGGSGEVEDARAAVEMLLQRGDISQVMIAGYSFGAAVALRLAGSEPRLKAAASIAPPLLMFDMSAARTIRIPLLVVAGEHDDFCPRGALDRFVAGLDCATSSILPEADHFFASREREVAQTVAAFLASV